MTFSDELKYRTTYRLLWIRSLITLVIMVELLLTFVLAHWLGNRLRAALRWAVNRL
jgi:hypothetical protein